MSDLYRLVRDDDGLQVDFMATIHGMRSFEGVRDRATPIDIGGGPLLVASLADIIKSKRAAARPRDRGRVKKPPSRKRRLAAVRREAERALVDMIRRRLALPPEARTNFLRNRVAPGRSAL